MKIQKLPTEDHIIIKVNPPYILELEWHDVRYYGFDFAHNLPYKTIINHDSDLEMRSFVKMTVPCTVMIWSGGNYYLMETEPSPADKHILKAVSYEQMVLDHSIDHMMRCDLYVKDNQIEQIVTPRTSAAGYPYRWSDAAGTFDHSPYLTENEMAELAQKGYIEISVIDDCGPMSARPPKIKKERK